ncbi:hypothetical protein ACFWA9_02810 [Kitasatospora sp. NPDC059973]
MTEFLQSLGLPTMLIDEVLGALAAVAAASRTAVRSTPTPVWWAGRC